MIFFIIPAYNEENSIDKLFTSINNKMRDLNEDYRLVVVDDGSSDGTVGKIESYKNTIPLTLLCHERNMNVGEVFRTGFKHVLAKAKDNDIIVTKESDNTGDLSILPEMLNKIRSGYDVALASCYAKGGGIVGTTIDRIVLSSVANNILRTIFPIKGVRTYSSFYRAYNAQSIKKAYDVYKWRLIEENGFVSMVEMLVKISKLGMKIVDVPMVLRCDSREGSSKMNKTKTMLAYFSFIIKGIKGRLDPKKEVE